MLLAIDVGNTHTVVGLYAEKNLRQHWRLETQKERTADELGILLLELFRLCGEATHVDAIMIANVVPSLQHALQRLGERYFRCEPCFVEGSMDTGITVKIENPQEIGADRLVNAVAAHHHVPHDDVIVVDLGTATTFDYVTRHAEYLGGAIAPGILSSNEALAQKASRLPRTDIRRPERVIGHSTLQSMQSGVYFGYVSLVDGLVQRMQAERGCSSRVLATGGLAGLLAQESKTIQEVLPDLTLDGLRLLWERRQER